MAKVSRRWRSSNTHPLRRGWYEVRRPDGSTDWRAWGRGQWWVQLKGGGWFGAVEWKGQYEWRGPGKSIDLDYKDLLVLT